MSLRGIAHICLGQVATAAALPQLLNLGGLFGSGSSPQVQLDYATFQGGASQPGIDSFLGMPFASAGRLEEAQLYSAGALSGVQDATKYGMSCPQVELIASPLSGDNAQLGSLLADVEELFPKILDQGEDCLSINVQVPQGVNDTSKLPVMFWIHGGGFELGSSAALGGETTAVQGLIYQGGNIVSRSVEMNQPVIFVSANHRLNAFGFLASQEITDAGVSNLGLKDQRLAMKWIQKYISHFGGDPEKVTLFGESAGSMSIAIQMLLNGGDNEGLFRGAIMASGGPAKFQDYHHAQGTFEFVANAVGCGISPDKLGCLRSVDYNDLLNAVNQLPNFLSYESTVVPWYPRPDGTYLKASPHTLLREGQVADIPYIIGDMKDEGTLFCLVNQLNVTDDADFNAYLKQVFFQNATDEQISALAAHYSNDPAAGSPFDTGAANEITPQYKRLAAFVGDYTFQAPRRDLLSYTSGSSNKHYTYLIEDSLPLLGQSSLLSGLGLTNLPLLGSFHVSDVVLYDFGLLPASLSQNTLNLMSTYIAFVNSLDPNNHGLTDLPQWPAWDPEERSMFVYKEDGPVIIKDDYRDTAMSFINDHADVYVY